MNSISKGIAYLTLGLSLTSLYAAPDYLLTHNNTALESNAFIAGIPSIYPTKANSTGKVYWNMVRLVCHGHTTLDGRCPAVIKMGTDTDHPIEVGTVYLDLTTGAIEPSQIIANGYTMTATGPGEATISVTMP